MKSERLGFYVWATNNVDNVNHILEKLREHYPNSPVTISSDCGEDFSVIAETHKAQYIQGTHIKHGHPRKLRRYGWSVTEASVWLNRLYHACIMMDSEYVMVMDECLLIKETFNFPDSDIIMYQITEGQNLISNAGIEWIKSRGGNHHLSYGFGSGSILNRKSFIEAYRKHIDDLLLNYERLFLQSMNEGNMSWGWNDNLVCVLMYANNCSVSYDLPIAEYGNNTAVPILCNYKIHQPKTLKVHYISFITQGEPYDHGQNFGHLKQMLIDEYSSVFDKVTIYTAEDVPEEFRKRYDPEIFETRFNLEYHNIGYGAFKPYLILKTMEETDCDVVYWRDGNIEKIPNMLIGKESAKYLSLEILDEIGTDIYVPFENSHWVIGNTTPSVVFEKILGNTSDNYVNYIQMNAALIICKKTDYVKKLMNEWINWMKHDEFFYKNQPINHEGWNMNCGDQGVLNAILLKEIRKGNLPQNWPHFGYENRQFIRTKLYEIKNLPKIMNTITVNEHTFFPEKLDKNPIVVDLGCSEGGFFKNFKTQFNYGKFIGIEANPINYEKIKDFNNDNTIIINAAVCSEDRSEKNISFVVATNDSALGSFVFDEKSIALSDPNNDLKRFTVPTIKMSDIFETYKLEKIDILKVDIEGAEWEVLESLDESLLNKITQISVEFHDFIDPSKKEKTKEVIERLKSFGYNVIVSGAPWFYGTEHFDCTFYKD